MTEWFDIMGELKERNKKVKRTEYSILRIIATNRTMYECILDGMGYSWYHPNEIKDRYKLTYSQMDRFIQTGCERNDLCMFNGMIKRNMYGA